MTYSICQFFELDFWLMVVVSSCLLTSVQVLGSLVVYTLFIYDAIRDEPWEKLDDIVYYAKATTRVLEFIVAVFVVCYGVKESLTGDWSWVNTSILIIHCYFNVWQRLQAGWKSYLLRREAVKKIESLPLATTEQLAEFNDVCAICFQELRTACITPCHHFYHPLCLRKWLYVQENCPMCHQKIVLVKEEQQERQNNSEEQPGNDESVPGNQEPGLHGGGDISQPAEEDIYQQQEQQLHHSHPVQEHEAWFQHDSTGVGAGDVSNSQTVFSSNDIKYNRQVDRIASSVEEHSMTDFKASAPAQGSDIPEQISQSEQKYADTVSSNPDNENLS
jgi:hypothetical protein